MHGRCQEARPLPSQADIQASSQWAGVWVEPGRLGREEGEAWVWPVPDPRDPLLSFGAYQSFLGIAPGEVGSGPLPSRAVSLRRTVAAPQARLLPAPWPLGAAASRVRPARPVPFVSVLTPSGVGTKSASQAPLISSDERPFLDLGEGRSLLVFKEVWREGAGC